MTSGEAADLGRNIEDALAAVASVSAEGWNDTALEAIARTTDGWSPYITELALADLCERAASSDLLEKMTLPVADALERTLSETVGRVGGALASAAELLLAGPKLALPDSAIEDRILKARHLFAVASWIARAAAMPSLLARALIGHAYSYVAMPRGAVDFRDALSWLEEAVEVASSVPDPEGSRLAANAESLAGLLLSRIAQGNDAVWLEAQELCEQACQRIAGGPTDDTNLLVMGRRAEVLSALANVGPAEEVDLAGPLHETDAAIKRLSLRDVRGDEPRAAIAEYVLRGSAKLHRCQQADRNTHLRRAIANFELCRALSEGGRTFISLAELDLLIGETYLALTVSIERNIEEARRYLCASVEGTDDARTVHLAAKALGISYVRASDWDAAIRFLGLALTSVEAMYEASPGLEEQSDIAANLSGCCQALALSCARSGKPEAAANWLDRGRARGLNRLYATPPESLDRIREADGAAYDDYSQALKRYRHLRAVERAARVSASGGQASREEDEIDRSLAEAQDALSIAAKRVTDIEGMKNIFVRPPASDSRAEVFGTESGTSFVYMNVTPFGGDVIVVDESGARSESVPELTSDAVFRASKPYFAAYDAWRAEPSDKGKQRDFELAIDEIGSWLWQNMVGAALRLAKGSSKLVLLPFGSLAVLPLQAAWTEEEGNRRYALDSIPMVFAPTTEAYAQSLRLGDQNVRRILAVADPQPVSLRAIPETVWEVSIATTKFDQRRSFMSQNARREAILEALPWGNVVHLACHARYDFAEPLSSRLVLAFDEPLMLSDMLDTSFTDTRLVILSACETGLIDLAEPDEQLGFGAVLLAGGVSAVVGSLWSVADLGSLVLFSRFYDQWLSEGRLPHEALGEAQVWMRDTTNGEKADHFGPDRRTWMTPRDQSHLHDELRKLPPAERGHASPFYWAAYQYTGI